MTDFDERERAVEPEDLGRLFLERANAGDVDGLVASYESDAVVASAGRALVSGSGAIRLMYEALLADPPQFAGDVRPALRRGDFALTSTRFRGGATAEIARRQSDGTWLWAADQPNVVGSDAASDRPMIATGTRDQSRRRAAHS